MSMFDDQFPSMGIDIPGHSLAASVAITITCECGQSWTDPDQQALAHHVIRHMLDARERQREDPT